MPRHAAFYCLRSGSPKPLRTVERFARERGLDPRDTSLVRRIVGTEIRRRGTLRAVVGAFAHQRPKSDLATLMRIGVAQILYLDRVPEHAAVSETVRAAADILGLPKGRVVNAVLRNLLRELRPGRSGDPARDIEGANAHFDFPIFRDPKEHPHLWAEDALSIPAQLHKRWTQRFGLVVANELGRIAGDEAPLSIRLTRQAVAAGLGSDSDSDSGDASSAEASRDALASELRSLGVDVISGAHEKVLLSTGEFVGALVASAPFQEGRATIQGEHALRAAELCGDVAGLDVLDIAAAPGGKSVVLAEGGPRTLVALDVSASRLAQVSGAFERLRLQRPSLAAMDGTSALAPDAAFDIVLLDAPCSNTGVLAARPAARWRYGPKSQRDLTTLQRRLLESAATRVRPGGALVYSTCSLEPEENGRLVRDWAESQAETGPSWTLEEERESLPRAAAAGGPADGGYAVRYRRGPVT